MINKLNSTSFKGTILVKAGNKKRQDGNKAHIFNVSTENINTDNIVTISQHDKYGYTEIVTCNNNYEKDGLQFHFVPAWFTSSLDIMAAYNAAKNSNVSIELEDKSSK